MKIYALISIIMKSARNVSMMIYAPFFQFKLLRVKTCLGPWRTAVDLRAIFPIQAFARKSLSGTLADQCRLTRRFTNSSFLRVKACLRPWQSNVDLRAILPIQAFCA